MPTSAGSRLTAAPVVNKMTRRVAFALGALAIASSVVAGCSGDDESSSECGEVDQQFLDNLANQQAIDQLSDLSSVVLAEPVGGYEHLVAANVNTEEGEQAGVWATGPDSGPILAIDDVSRANSDWAIAEPGSDAEMVADELLASDDYAVVKSCLP